LGVGTGTHGWGGASDQTRLGTAAFVALLERAYQRGLNYFDLADQYGSHGYMREALKTTIPREEVMLLSKTASREADWVRDDIDRFRLELDTDVLDVVLLHFMTQSTWPEDMAPCMDVLSEAKAQGIIRAHGVSCHGLDALARVPDAPWVDVVLARINPFGVRMDATVDDVLSVLWETRRAGKGVLGMKIVGEGDLRDRIGDSIRFSVDAGCLDAITIGFLAPDELDQAIDHVESAKAAL
jgi:aryl-alcohol dehydrogenase-like predicted oxidoreductase